MNSVASSAEIDPDAQCPIHGCARHRCDADHALDPRIPGEAPTANLALADGWNETGIAGVEIEAEDGRPLHVSVRGEVTNAQVDAELARFGARVTSHDLWGVGVGEDESVCSLEVVS